MLGPQFHSWGCVLGLVWAWVNWSFDHSAPQQYLALRTKTTEERRISNQDDSVLYSFIQFMSQNMYTKEWRHHCIFKRFTYFYLRDNFSVLRAVFVYVRMHIIILCYQTLEVQGAWYAGHTCWGKAFAHGILGKIQGPDKQSIGNEHWWTLGLLSSLESSLS